MSVAKTLRQQLQDEDRPSDWYSQKNCALQYNRLLEMVEKPARKKKRPSGQSEDLLTPFIRLSLPRLSLPRLSLPRPSLRTINRSVDHNCSIG